MTASAMKTMEFKIDGMDCSSCVRGIETAIRGLPGIEDVKVSLADNNAVIKMNTALVTDNAIIEAIEDAGFDVPR